MRHSGNLINKMSYRGQNFVVVFLSLLSLTACGIPFSAGLDACNQEGTLLLYDDFHLDSNCGWFEYNRGGAVAARTEDEVLQVTTSQTGEVWWTNPGRIFDDVAITVSTEQISGPDDNAYGLICRYKSPENFYLFLISGDGYYAIGKYQSGNTNQITYLSGEGAYQFSEVINQGATINQVQANCRGNELSLLVNGLPLATVTDDTFSSGDVGVAVSTFQPGTAVIEFDDFTVQAP